MQVKDKYLIVGNARIGETDGFDWNAAVTAFLNLGMSIYEAQAKANAQKKLYEQQQDAARAAYYGNPGITPSGNIGTYLPYIAIGAVLLILLAKK